MGIVLCTIPERTMMSNEKSIFNLRAVAKVFLLAAEFWCAVLLAGCGKQDKVISFSSQEEQMMSLESAQTEEVSEAEPEDSPVPENIYVHVCGAVARPGVVKLALGSRAEDALLAAGGLLENAAQDYINLASRVEDGQQLYFPTREEVESLAVEQGNWVQETAKSQSTADGKVNINTADEALLCTLPGIGEARAQAILSYRQEHGAFQSKEDIMQVPGIKQSAYAKISDKIIVQ